MENVNKYVNFNDWDYEETYPSISSLDIKRLDILFYNFLQEQNVMYKLIDNCLNSNSNFESLYHSGDKRYILLLFNWGFSKEGYMFWGKISKKWRELIKI